MPDATVAPVPAHARSEMWDLENLRAARRLGDFMFAQFARHVRGDVVEVGAGIGTFSERLLAAGAQRLLAIEPEPLCAQRLRRELAGDTRVTVAEETLPGSPALAGWAGSADFVLCQNVLEHIEDDGEAVAAMASALRPAGALTVLVPAHPRLYGALDRAYGHHRRYTRERLRSVVEASGLAVEELYSFNLLGVAGWWVQKRRANPGISRRSLTAYEALLRLWGPVERRVRPPFGLSLIVHARRAAA